MNKQQKDYIKREFEKLNRIAISSAIDRDDRIMKILEEIYTKGYDAGYNLGKRHGKESETCYYIN